MDKNKEMLTGLEHKEVCPDWKEGCDEIDRMVMMSVVHGQGDFQAKSFICCPYCGEKFKDGGQRHP